MIIKEEDLLYDNNLQLLLYVGVKKEAVWLCKTNDNLSCKVHMYMQIYCVGIIEIIIQSLRRHKHTNSFANICD